MWSLGLHIHLYIARNRAVHLGLHYMYTGRGGLVAAVWQRATPVKFNSGVSAKKKPSALAISILSLRHVIFPPYRSRMDMRLSA